MDHFDRWNILTDKQHGFRRRRSCESQLIITIDALAKSLAKGEQVDVIFDVSYMLGPVQLVVDSNS
jgi:hypothetical protein